MKLASLSYITLGYTFRERLDAYPPGDIAVVQMKNLGPDDTLQSGDMPRVALPGFSEKQTLKKGDLILRARGLFYTASLLTENLGQAVIAAPLILIRVSSPKVLPEYLRWFINHPRTQASLANLATGSYVRTLNKQAVEELDITLPALERQRQIVAIAALGEKENALLDQIKKKRNKLLDAVLARYARAGGITPHRI